LQALIVFKKQEKEKAFGKMTKINLQILLII